MALTIFKNYYRLPYFNRKVMVAVVSVIIGGALGGLVTFFALKLLEALRR